MYIYERRLPKGVWQPVLQSIIEQAIKQITAQEGEAEAEKFSQQLASGNVVQVRGLEAYTEYRMGRPQS